MTQTKLIAGAVWNVGEHVVAIAFVSTCEVARRSFLDTFGYDYRSWPPYLLIALAITFYLIGFTSAALLRRRRARELAVREAQKAVSEAPAQPASERPSVDRRTIAVASLVAAVSVGLVAILRPKGRS